MNIFRYVAVLFLITSVGHGHVPQKHDRVESSRQAETPVRSLYRYLVSHPIAGIPTPEEMKVLSPYLSSSLVHRIEQARACNDDYFRLHPKRDVKPPLDWLESGLFSGANDRSGPGEFKIEKMELQGDRSFRAYVKLTEGPPEKPWTWLVAVIVVSKDGQFAINDVIYLKDDDTDVEDRLSDLLTRGCDGSHWVG